MKQPRSFPLTDREKKDLQNVEFEIELLPDTPPNEPETELLSEGDGGSLVSGGSQASANTSMSKKQTNKRNYMYCMHADVSHNKREVLF